MLARHPIGHCKQVQRCLDLAQRYAPPTLLLQLRQCFDKLPRLQTTSDIELEIEDLLYNSLTPPEQEQLKYQSWKNIFDVCQQKQPLQHKNSQFIQATFWQLRSEQVIDVRYFNSK